MTIVAFEGGAGCGKTYQLIASLSKILQKTPLREGQRVLAVTFMHGSRRRLDDRLRSVAMLGNRYECLTIDSFAWRLIKRWRALSDQLGLHDPCEAEYEKVCDAAGALAEYPAVSSWICSSFPIIVVDEAQDLTPSRLRIIRAIVDTGVLLVAADEFQCLEESLRPNPFASWLHTVAIPAILTKPERTNAAGLLAAAAALRGGMAPICHKPSFNIETTPTATLAGTFAANQIGWYARGGKIAIITPSSKDFAPKVVQWVKDNRTKNGNGPFNIKWEHGENYVSKEVLAKLILPDELSLDKAIAEIAAQLEPNIAAYFRSWLEMQRRATGRNKIRRDEIIEAVKRALAHLRRFQRSKEGSLSAMTVHTAKNREFDGVIVLWPYTLKADDEQKRRLLYNAITRAKKWCLVLVQNDKLRLQPPFV
jgi:superfamily I DNA/RNA helicase